MQEYRRSNPDGLAINRADERLSKSGQKFQEAHDLADSFLALCLT